MSQPVRVKTYAGVNQAASAAEFEVDANKAAAAGYIVASQAWDGSSLTVVYQLQTPSAPPAQYVAPPPAIPQPPAGAAKKKNSGCGGVATLLVSVAVVWFVFFRGNSPTTVPSGGGGGGGTKVQQPVATPRAQAATLTDGTLTVGSDVSPGMYRSRTTVNCYWARLSGFTGELGDILANANVSGYAVVVVKSTDKGLENNGCELSKDMTAVLAPGATVPNGIFLVGVDLQPGTYRTSGDCYWARLSGFGGSTDDILANDNISGSAVVTIQRGDKAFESSGCNGWTKAG